MSKRLDQLYHGKLTLMDLRFGGVEAEIADVERAGLSEQPPLCFSINL
jgi:hypothetical protein